MNRRILAVACAVAIAVCMAHGGASLVGSLEQRVVTMTETATGCVATNAFTGGGVWRLVDVMSTATGGTLTVEISTGITGADGSDVRRRIGTLTVSTSTNRVLTAGTADYIWSGQSLVFSTSTNNAGSHKVFPTLERIRAD
jgi:hypothetical protein